MLFNKKIVRECGINDSAMDWLEMSEDGIAYAVTDCGGDRKDYVREGVIKNLIQVPKESYGELVAAKRKAAKASAKRLAGYADTPRSTELWLKEICVTCGLPNAECEGHLGIF